MKDFILHKKSKFRILTAALMGLGFIPSSLSAESFTELVASDMFLTGILSLEIFLIFVALALLVAVTRIRLILFAKYDEEEGVEAKEVSKSIFEVWREKLTDAVPVEKEKNILLDHDYDGIQELDNNLPPWWKMMFNLTIVFAVVYLGYYHIFDYGKSSAEEYEYEMAMAEQEMSKYMATSGSAIDENNVELLTSESSITSGQKIFSMNCAPCHGTEGQGGIGPNLADNYWIHGGSIADIFKTIKNGVPEKGMISWKAQLSPVQIQNVASYIISIEGSNPPNPKEAEGKLFERDSKGQLGMN